MERHEMTVGELRQAIDGLPDETVVLAYSQTTWFAGSYRIGAKRLAKHTSALTFGVLLESGDGSEIERIGLAKHALAGFRFPVDPYSPSVAREIVVYPHNSRTVPVGIARHARTVALCKAKHPLVVTKRLAIHTRGDCGSQRFSRT
jgi:hypothetical protein